MVHRTSTLGVGLAIATVNLPNTDQCSVHCVHSHGFPWRLKGHYWQWLAVVRLPDVVGNPLARFPCAAEYHRKQVGSSSLRKLSWASLLFEAPRVRGTAQTQFDWSNLRAYNETHWLSQCREHFSGALHKKHVRLKLTLHHKVVNWQKKLPHNCNRKFLTHRSYVYLDKGYRVRKQQIRKLRSQAWPLSKASPLKVTKYFPVPWGQNASSLKSSHSPYLPWKDGLEDVVAPARPWSCRQLCIACLQEVLTPSSPSSCSLNQMLLC